VPVPEAARRPTLHHGLLAGSCSGADLQAQIEMFGVKANRGTMIVNLVLCHYAAYRRQLFLYLKPAAARI